MMNTTDLRVYFACLASYNNGVLHGVWVEGDDLLDEDTIQERVSEMLRDSRFPNVQVECPVCENTGDDCPTCGGSGVVPSAEECAVHDFEGFGGLLSEYASFEHIAHHAQMIDEHGEAWVSYCDWIGIDDATEDNFKESYIGEWDTEEDFARHYFEDCDCTLYQVLEEYNAIRYFDVEAYSRDLFLGVYTLNNGHVFRSC